MLHQLLGGKQSRLHRTLCDQQGHPWGGMHSTAPDLACCLRMMLCGGTYAGKRILSAASARAMVTNQNSHLVLKPWGIGFGLAGSVDWNCTLVTFSLQEEAMS